VRQCGRNEQTVAATPSLACYLFPEEGSVETSLSYQAKREVLQQVAPQPTRREMLTEGTTPEEAEIIGEHFTYLEHLTREGIAVLIGHTLTTDQDTMGIVIYKAGSDEEARTLMNADPAVSKGMMSAKLYPFRIALQAPGHDPDERIQTGSGDE
jgi:uncharacterized protein YciI